MMLDVRLLDAIDRSEVTEQLCDALGLDPYCVELATIDIRDLLYCELLEPEHRVSIGLSLLTGEEVHCALEALGIIDEGSYCDDPGFAIATYCGSAADNGQSGSWTGRLADAYRDVSEAMADEVQWRKHD